jgi:hypothetical protein
VSLDDLAGGSFAVPVNYQPLPKPNPVGTDGHSRRQLAKSTIMVAWHKTCLLSAGPPQAFDETLGELRPPTAFE